MRCQSWQKNVHFGYIKMQCAPLQEHSLVLCCMQHAPWHVVTTLSSQEWAEDNRASQTISEMDSQASQTSISRIFSCTLESMKAFQLNPIHLLTPHAFSSTWSLFLAPTVHFHLPSRPGIIRDMTCALSLLRQHAVHCEMQHAFVASLGCIAKLKQLSYLKLYKLNPAVRFTFRCQYMYL